MVISHKYIFIQSSVFNKLILNTRIFHQDKSSRLKRQYQALLLHIYFYFCRQRGHAIQRLCEKYFVAIVQRSNISIYRVNVSYHIHKNDTRRFISYSPSIQCIGYRYVLPTVKYILLFLQTMRRFNMAIMLEIFLCHFLMYKYLPLSQCVGVGYTQK